MVRKRQSPLRSAGRALFHGLFVFVMMLLVEFSITGNIEAYHWYLMAALLVTCLLIPRYNQQDSQRQAAVDQQSPS